MPFPPTTLDTERLHLRPPVMEDAPAIHGYCSDPDVVRYMAFPRHESIDDATTFLASAIETWEVGEGHRPWSIVRRTDGAFVGMLGTTVDVHGVMLGYILDRTFWGQGYMTEAVRGVVEAAFVDPRVHRVWAYCDVDNVGSARVMAKAGMQLEGTLRRYQPHPNVSDVPRDCHVYAIVRESPP